MSNRKTRIWRGCTGILSSMLTVAICMSTVAFSIDGSINAALGIKSTKLVKTGDEETDTAWYKSDYGDVIKDVYKRQVLEQDDPYGDGRSPDDLAAVCHVQEVR